MSTFRFGAFVLDQRAYLLTGEGGTVELSPKAIDLLLLFVNEPGVLFTKDGIFDRLWPDVTVTDNALTQVISELRQALGDKPSAPRFIETVARRGYRWIAKVEADTPSVAPPHGGPAQVFAAHSAEAEQLQSAIVTALMAGLRVTIAATPTQPGSARETSSLEAHRLTSEGRVKLETLDPKSTQSAVADFTRAIALDPSYTAAHIGLAHARFWMYQATRARNRPDRAELDSAIAHAERAAALDPASAEPHAALAFFLSITPRVEDARREGRLAVSIDPGNWRHQFQLGIAAWGGERLECLSAVIAQFPALTHAHFAAAMVHIARNDLDAADAVLAGGLDTQQRTSSDRLPGRGLHWLRGLIAFRRGDDAAAGAAFDAEIASGGTDLFADEFAMDAKSARGFVALAAGDAQSAADWFGRALTRVPEHARSWTGLAAARARLGDARGAVAAQMRAEEARADLAAHGREAEAVMAEALAAVLNDEVAAGCAAINRLLDATPAGLPGWTTPVEPWLRPHLQRPDVQMLLQRIADRAR
jgi:DNA-binding winged helix-turn-helix (wHTH) protein/tetratricopeptide (TPR) repeat protein